MCFDCRQVYWTSILRRAGEVSSHSSLQCASLLKPSFLTRLCLASAKSRQPSLFRPPRSLDLFHGTLHTRLLSRPPSKSPDRRSIHPPCHWLPLCSGIPSSTDPKREKLTFISPPPTRDLHTPSMPLPAAQFEKPVRGSELLPMPMAASGVIDASGSDVVALAELPSRNLCLRTLHMRPKRSISRTVTVTGGPRCLRLGLRSRTLPLPASPRRGQRGSVADSGVREWHSSCRLGFVRRRNA